MKDQATMRALVKSERKPGLWMEEVPVPEIGPHDVLIRILRSAICGTDVHIYNWDQWAQATIPVPMTIGHEFMGEVAAIGEEVTDFTPGERVSGEGHITCGRCRNCRAGKRHLCPHTVGVGVNRPGGFAEFVSIPAQNTYKLPMRSARRDRRHTRSLRQRRAYGVILRSRRRGCADHRRRADRLHGGGIARRAGARHIVVTDLNPYRLDLANASAPPARSISAASSSRRSCASLA